MLDPELEASPNFYTLVSCGASVPQRSRMSLSELHVIVGLNRHWLVEEAVEGQLRCRRDVKRPLGAVAHEMSSRCTEKPSKEQVPAAESKSHPSAQIGVNALAVEVRAARNPALNADRDRVLESPSSSPSSRLSEVIPEPAA